MKKLILISLIIVCNACSIFALEIYPVKEDSTEQIKSEVKKNLSYIELGGNGIILSINYERYISENLSFRIGLGTVPAPFTITAFYPIMMNYTFESPFEVGLGIVLFNFSGGFLRDDIFADKTKGTIITSVIGFKKRYNWFLFKASFTPFFNPVNSKIQLYGGISFGVTF